jgi:hypothetical protein
MIDEIALADPARDAVPTAADEARMDERMHRLLAAETPAGVAGDARRGAAGEGRSGRPRRTRGGRRRAWVIVPPAALATAALTLGVALPGGKTPAVLQPAPASAATVLADLQRKVAGAPAQSGRYAYLKQLTYTTHMRPDNETKVLPHEYEQWVADDGSGVVKQVIYWDEPQPRQGPFDGTPHAMEDIEVLGMDLDEVRALPTDPAQLKAKLENRDNVMVTAYAGALLSFAGTPPEVKVALFEVLKAVPGAELIPSVTDPLKRTGVGVQFDDEAWRTLFLFDPGTGALLGTRSIGKKEIPGRTIEDWNLTVESGRTDTAPKTAR